MPGVVRTRVGYAGGTSKHPTYKNIGDHTEALEVLYDPSVVSFGELLKVFWASHDGCRSGGHTQYLNILFVHDAEQRLEAEASRDAEAAKRERKIRTPIRDAGTFYVAEDYHQKYRLRGNRTLRRAFGKLFANEADFRDSTATARVNGWLAGYGKAEEYRAVRDRLGLPEETLRRLDELFGGPEAS